MRRTACLDESSALSCSSASSELSDASVESFSSASSGGVLKVWTDANLDSYVAYCAATTDSVALFRKLDELKEAEIAYNEKSGMMSTCDLRLPPTVTAVAGSCRESPRKDAAPR